MFYALECVAYCFCYGETAAAAAARAAEECSRNIWFDNNNIMYYMNRVKTHINLV